MKKIIRGLLSVLILPALSFCNDATAGVHTGVKEASAALKAQSSQFKKGVYKVTDGVHVAIGFGLANSILIEGKDGVIIVDTMETMEEGRAVRAAFEKITKKPVKALIYTHNHTDHVFGSAVYEDYKPEVYAHETTNYYLKRIASKLRPVIGVRAMRMFGVYLDQEGLVNCGIGPRLSMNEKSNIGILPPTKTFKDMLDVTVAGVRLKLVFAPGETDDQIFVWLPDKKVLMPGDNFYASFPNLYTIRGTHYRSPIKWVKSLDKMRSMQPEFLVPSHTNPLKGAAKIEVALRDYRDALQFVHDQTIRGINTGLTPDELVEKVKLPAHLAASPYLQEFYGKVSWSVRGVFMGNLGWFDGNSATLQPLPPKKQATLMAELAGGESKLLKAAETKFSNGEFQSALQLSGHVLRLSPGDAGAKKVRVDSLMKLAAVEKNANARHYYLTEALEIRDDFLARERVKPSPATVHSFPNEVYFTLIGVGLDPVASVDLDQKVGFVFTDSNERYTMHVRRGVAVIHKKLLPNLDIKVRLDSRKWKEMLAKLRNPLTTVAGFQFDKGGSIGFMKFLSLFKPEDMKLPYAAK